MMESMWGKIISLDDNYERKGWARYFDLNASFLFSVLIHVFVLSLPLYYLPQTVRYVPVINLTPVELLVVEPVKPNLLYTKGKTADFKQTVLSPRHVLSNISPAPLDSKKNLEKKDFSKLDILDGKNSKIVTSKGTSFFPEDKKNSYSSEKLSSKGLVNSNAGRKEDGDKLIPFSTSSEGKDWLEDSFDFGGTVGKRWVRSKPREKPNPEVDKEVTIMLRFWVTPFGQVFDVVPEKKGGAFLEKTAIDYLRKWTFDPLPSDVVQENQWGILPVRFRKR
ncbi:MAG: hypothetical protein ABII25_02315 [bacterium]